MIAANASRLVALSLAVCGVLSALITTPANAADQRVSVYGATSASGGTSDYTGTYSGSYTFSYTDYQASWNISYTWTETTTYSQCSLASQQCTTATTATVNGTNAISVPRAGIPQTYGIEVIVNPADESCRLTSTGKTYRGTIPPEDDDGQAVPPIQWYAPTYSETDPLLGVTVTGSGSVCKALTELDAEDQPVPGGGVTTAGCPNGTLTTESGSESSFKTALLGSDAPAEASSTSKPPIRLSYGGSFGCTFASGGSMHVADQATVALSGSGACTVPTASSTSSTKSATDTSSSDVQLTTSPISPTFRTETSEQATGALRPGESRELQIWYLEGHSSTRVANVTGKTWQVSPGQQIELEVDCGTGGAPAPYEWTIPKLTDNLATTSAISNYVIDTGPNPGDNYAQAKLLDAADLHDNAVTFRFVHTGRFKVSVNTGTGDANTTFEVISPEIINPSTAYTFCSVGLDWSTAYKTPSGRGVTSPPALSLGLNDRCGETPGVAWDWKVTAPRLLPSLGTGTGSGQISMVQLFTKASSNGLQQNNVVVRSADDESFYDYRALGAATIVSVGAGATAEWKDSDSPHLGLDNPTIVDRQFKIGTTAYERMDAYDYVMFRSATPDSSWIPIAELVWHWSGSAELQRTKGHPIGTWRLVGEEDNPYTNASYYDSIVAPLPQWSTAT